MKPPNERNESAWRTTNRASPARPQGQGHGRSWSVGHFVSAEQSSSSYRREEIVARSSHRPPKCYPKGQAFIYRWGA